MTRRILSAFLVLLLLTVFGLITAAHLSRVFVEGPRMLKEPEFIPLTVLAASLCVWAWTLLKGLPRS